MEYEKRLSGIECVGNIPWGTHLCQFYESKQDLVDVLTSYFRAGLENAEFCIWITSEPLTVEQAVTAARDAIPGLDRYLLQGQIEILPYDEWYLRDGVFDVQRVLDGWIEKLNRAKALGFAGLRLSGNTFWLERASWDGFVDYEEQIDRVIGSLPMIALCSYSLQRCRGSDVLDVLRNHRFALIRRRGDWELVESSELKRTKEALQESEARFRWLAENAPDIIFRFEIAPKLRISYVSPAVTDILGYDPEELYADIDMLIGSVRPQDREAFRKLLDDDSVVEPMIIGCRHKQGQRVWLELRVAPLCNDHRQPIALEGIARDITERYRNEERLRFVADASSTLAASLDYQTIVDIIGKLAVPRIADWCSVDVIERDGPLRLVMLAHQDPEKVRWAHELRQRYPLDPNAPVGAPRVIRTGQPELYPEIPDSLLVSIAKNEDELRILREVECRSIMIVPLQAHGRTLGAITLVSSRSGRYYGQDDLELAMELARRAAVAMENARLYRDREQTEQELRETRDYLEKLVNYANAPIIVWDPAFRITQFNQAFERLTGYRSVEVLGRNLSMLFPKPSRKESLEKIARTLEGEYWESVEIPILRKDDETRIALWNSANIYAEDGKTLVATIAQGQDITERKRAEEEIRKLNSDLTQRAQDLDAINKELESFSYSVSHDLRAPLRGIDGFSQALLEEYGDRLDDQGQQYLRRVRAASQRMACLIDDILTLSRVTRHELVRKEIDLSALAEDAAADLRKAEPERHVEFIIEPNLVVSGDTRLLATVLENLIGNAWKFTSKHPSARIEFGTTSQRGNTVYFVRDDGAGFDMAYAEKLFGTFQRLHSQTEFPGTGIGLATVQRIIRRHGGRVWAEGAPEQGATFYFTLETRCTGESDRENTRRGMDERQDNSAG